MSRFLACRPQLLIGGLLLATVPVQAQSGATAIKKVADAYAALNSYEGTSSLDARILSKGKVLRNVSNTVYLKYQQPNKLNLQITSNNGTLSAVSDGKDLIVYDARSNAYIKVPAPPNGKKLMEEVALRAGISAFMDPLYFLTKYPIPASMSSFAVKGSETLNGHAVTVITGVEKLPKGRTRNWKWWVDKETGLLRKIEGVTDLQTVNATQMQGKTRVPTTLQISQMTRHNIAELKANPNLGGDAFRFDIPPNAIVKKSMKELMQGK